MWMPNRASPRPQRTPSVHSIASVHSNQSRSVNSAQYRRQSRGYESDQSSDITVEENNATVGRRPDTSMPPMWQSPRQQTTFTASQISQKMGGDHGAVVSVTPSSLKKHNQQQRAAVNRPVDDDATSRSSTLDGNEEEFAFPKVPKSLSTKRDHLDQEPRAPAPAPHVPGPLESQLAALMSKLIYIEQANPTVSVEPEEYQEMKARIKTLEEEKKTWWKRHEAIWALRDEDVENNIKIRGMLAKARRELEGMTKLRDEDLLNVQIVRNKLAEKTRENERLLAQTGRASPNRARPGSVFAGRGTTDLFTAAKIAALEQRALELEKRNSDLVAQLEASRGGMGIDDLNRMTAHQAWKGTVSDLETKLKMKDAEIARLRTGTGGASSGPSMDWYRIEGMLEEHAMYREQVGGKLQALRSEKEMLQKEVHRKEDECQMLEMKVQSLQRRVSVM